MKTNPQAMSPHLPLRIFLCVLSFASFMTSLTLGEHILFESNIVALGVTAIAVAACLWLVYRAWFRLSRPFHYACLWMLAILFPTIIVLGKSFLALGTAELISAQKLKTLLFFIGRVPFYFAVMRLMLHALRKKRNSKGFKGGTFSYTIGFICLWLPYWVLTFPGTLSNDSITQTREILGALPMSNANPIFQTCLIRFFLNISNALGDTDAMIYLYCGVQMLLMALLLGNLLSRMNQSPAPRWLVCVSALFYALCPIFPSFVFCVGKDTNFAMAILFFSLTIWTILKPEESKRLRPLQLLSLCAATTLCILLRNPGVYLALLTLLALLVWTLLKSNRSTKLWIAPVCALLVLVAVYSSLHTVIIPKQNIAPMPETESYSLPLQQVARVAVSQELTAEEAAALDGVLDMSILKESYNPELSDPVKNLWRADASDAQKDAFWATWFSLLKKHPATCFSATFSNTFGYMYPGFISTIKPTLLIGNQSSRTANLDGLLTYTVNPSAAKLKSFTDTLPEFTPYRILISPGLYGWITLFTFASLCHLKDKRNLIAVVPAVFTLLGCVLSAVNGYFRYAMPLYLCAPFLLWLCTCPPVMNIKPCKQK